MSDWFSNIMGTLDGEEPPAPAPAKAPNKTAGGAATPDPLKTVKPESLPLGDFLSKMLPPQGVYNVFTTGDKRNYWANSLEELAATIDRLGKRTDIYYAVASFKQAGTEYAGRTQDNVAQLKVFRLDIDAGAAKIAKHGPGAVYENQPQALEAVLELSERTGLVPSLIVSSGEGLHVYYELAEPVVSEQWRPVAKSLQKFGTAHGLKIDSSVTADHARVLRPVGTLHPNGKTVAVLEATDKVYTLAEFKALVGAAPVGEVALASSGFSADDLAVNADLEGLEIDHRPKSIKLILEQCGAMRHLAEHQATVPEPLWRLGIGIAKHTVEGFDGAKELSRQHPGYDEQELREKFDRWAAGPSTCERFQEHTPTQCAGCKHRGKITSPIQTGAVVEVAPPGTQAARQPNSVPDYVALLNRRHALVRRGAEMVILDECTPTVTARGVTLGRDWLRVVAFRQMYQGRVVEVETPAGETKKLPLANTWLNHTGRRQYDGTVFAPLEEVPDNILNLYAGFAVSPQAGDVTPWLELLEALIPDPADRRYVVLWLAWKVQNPGGVPDTILILIGKKGTGKNSLFDPLIVLFGIHAMLVDNPELIAGRFTGHLMDKCFVVLDEAVFTRDPRQQDAMKSRTTAKVMMYEDKGMPPVSGINRCAYVMLTNHEHAWQATTDERRAVVVEVGDGLRGNLGFWKRYHAWVKGDGPAALLHHLQQMDLSGFDPRAIPKGEALRKQIELTALRDPAVAWWHRCLSEGAVRCRDGGMDRVLVLNIDEPTEVDVHLVRESYEQTAGSRGANGTGWPQVAKRLNAWCGPAGLHKARPRADTGVRLHRYTLPSLAVLREHFTKATNVVLEP